jgi:hypothetical protein
VSANNADPQANPSRSESRIESSGGTTAPPARAKESGASAHCAAKRGEAMTELMLATLARRYADRNMPDPIDNARTALLSKPSCISWEDHYQSLLAQVQLLRFPPPDPTPQ